jgi:heavy metal translocating P-type ATPase
MRKQRISGRTSLRAAGNWQSILLFMSLAGLILGGLTWLGGYQRIAEFAWAAATLAALIPLSISILRDLIHRRAGVDLIALLALAGSLCLREYFAGAVIAVMYWSGRALEEYARTRAQQELSALLERMPRFAHRIQGDTLDSVPLDRIAIGDLLLVNTGDIVPVDGLVEGSTAVLDEAALTGEARPVEHGPGDAVRSGTANAGAPFNLRATAPAAASTYAGIVRLVQQAQSSRAPLVRLADRYAVAFLPLTLIIAAGAWLASGDPSRALAVLVVATPCPLILAAPVALVAGISRAARRGVIVKDGGALEMLAGVRVLLLDKTGTLTAGKPTLAEIISPTQDPAALLQLAASIDQASPHVLAAAIVRAARAQNLQLSFPQDVAEDLGKGIRGIVDAVEVRLGRLEWIIPGLSAPPWVRKLRRRRGLEGLSAVYVALDGKLAGALILDDPIRPDSPRTLRELRRQGLRRIVMLTGDRAEVAEMVGAAVGVDEVLAERIPSEKVDAVRQESANGPTVMVGDGINDAPALAAADVGVAMGARGASASSEAADVVLVVDRLDRLAEGIGIAKRSRRIALQSVFAGMGLSLIAMVFAALGHIPPVAGALLQEAIDVAVILNALRALTGNRSHVSVNGSEMQLAQRFQAEHAELLPLVGQLRSLADRIDYQPPKETLAQAQALAQQLTGKLLPHEHAEEFEFYPVVGRLLGAADATGTMSRAHAEIVHQTRVLCRLLDELTPEGPEPEDLPELRKLLYGLHAILSLHFAQENADYLSLIETPEAERVPA